MSAWLTLAGVQIIACPSSGITVRSGIVQRDGEAVHRGAGGIILILSALHDQDGTAMRADVGTEVFPPCGRTALAAAADTWIATWKLFCQAWSLTRSPSKSMFVVAVQVCLIAAGRSTSEFDEEVVDDAPVSSVRVAWTGARTAAAAQQHCAVDPPPP